MKNLILYISFLIIFSSTSYAGPGGGHSHDSKQEISSTIAIELSKKLLANLVKTKRVESSWSAVKNEEKVEQIEFRGQQVWSATFLNETLGDSEKSKIYTFISLSGEILGASYEAIPKPKAHSHGGGKPHTH